MGHLLHSRLLKGKAEGLVKRREAVVRQLFSEKMFGLNGIRSLASDEARYRPGAYHNGSVWIWDNYLIVQGLAVHGYNKLASFLADRLLDDVEVTKRFPEYLRGDNSKEHRLNTAKIVVYDEKMDRENVVEQPPQDIQAWSVAAILGIKQHRQETRRSGISATRGSDFEKSILAKVHFD